MEDDFNKSVSRHDLNQSSRLDLDWDPDASTDVGEDLMSRIVESGSDADSSASPASLCSSHASSEGSFDRGQGGSEPQHEQAATNGRSDHNNRNEEQTAEDQNDGMAKCPPGGSSHKNQKQFDHSRSTVTGTSTDEEEKVEREKRKLIKIKLWDPGDESAKSTTITVAVNDEVASIIQANENRSIHQIGLGTKQKLHLEETTASGGRDTAVDIMWQPNAGMGAEEEEKWEKEWAPPSIELPPQVRKQVSDNRESGAKERDASPQRMPTGESSTPQPKSSSSSNKLKQQQESSKNVKGLEPFTIPSILSSTVVKRTPTEKIGLAFRKANGTIVIEKIAPGSAFDGSALRPGHECLCINGIRLRSARRAAEIVRESASELTLMASNAPRPPGTMYTIISLRDLDLSSGDDYAAGMKFSMKHGLVQLVDATNDCPVNGTSLKVGDFILAIDGAVVGNVQTAVGVLDKSRGNDAVPLLYFNMRHLRVSLVDKVIGVNWKKEWSNAYDECVVSQPSGPSRPLILKFSERGIELSLRDSRPDNGSPVVPSDHPLLSVVDVLNHGITCVLSAIRQGVELCTDNGEVHDGDGSRSLAKLSQLYHEGLLSKDDFGALKTRLVK